jgi:hypothetical protein
VERRRVRSWKAAGNMMTNARQRFEFLASFAHRPSRGTRSSRRLQAPARVLLGVVIAVALVGLVGDHAQATQRGTSESDGSSPTIWTVEGTPNPDTDNQFLGLWCSAPESCMAVGSSEDGSSPEAFAATWDGSTWTATSDPDPGADAELDSVWCADADARIAVGQDPRNPFPGSPSPGTAPLGQRWRIPSTGPILSVSRAFPSQIVWPSVRAVQTPWRRRGTDQCGR